MIWSGERRHGDDPLVALQTLTREVATQLHPPVGRRVKAVVVARRQVNDHVEQGVVRRRQQPVLEGRRV